MPDCDFCEIEVGEDCFCFGCNRYVCDECNVNYMLSFGAHDPEDHLIDPLEDYNDNS